MILASCYFGDAETCLSLAAEHYGVLRVDPGLTLRDGYESLVLALSRRRFVTVNSFRKILRSVGRDPYAVAVPGADLEFVFSDFRKIGGGHKLGLGAFL